MIIILRLEFKNNVTSPVVKRMKNFREFFDLTGDSAEKLFKLEKVRGIQLARAVHEITHRVEDRKEQLDLILDLSKTFNEMIFVLHFWGFYVGQHLAQEQVISFLPEILKLALPVNRHDELSKIIHQKLKERMN